jgi:branched-chain amino acid transport system ATP-binding protein
MGAPKLLMLDEPSIGLAQIVKEKIFEGIKKIKKTGVTILIVEQDSVMAMGIADRIYILEGGNISKGGDAKEVMSDNHVRDAYLGVG